MQNHPYMFLRAPKTKMNPIKASRKDLHEQNFLHVKTTKNLYARRSLTKQNPRPCSV